MTIATLPRLILADTHIPTYPMFSDAADITMLRYSPCLPDGPFHWAQPGDVTSPTRELTVGVVAELLMASGVNPEADTDYLVTTVDRMLSLFGCDLTMPAAIVAGLLAEHWECAQAQMDRYTLAAGRLCGVEL